MEFNKQPHRKGGFRERVQKDRVSRKACMHLAGIWKVKVTFFFWFLISESRHATWQRLHRDVWEKPWLKLPVSALRRCFRGVKAHYLIKSLITPPIYCWGTWNALPTQSYRWNWEQCPKPFNFFKWQFKLQGMAKLTITFLMLPVKERDGVQSSLKLL